MPQLSRMEGGWHRKALALDSLLWTNDSGWRPPPAQVPLRWHASQGDTFSFLSKRMQTAEGTGIHNQRTYFWSLRSALFVGDWVEPALRPSASSPCGFGGIGRKQMAPLTSGSFGYWRPRWQALTLLFPQKKQKGLKCGRCCSLDWGCEAERQTQS